MNLERTVICYCPSIIIKLEACSRKSSACINCKRTTCVKLKFISYAYSSGCIAYSCAVEGIRIAGYSLCCSSIEVDSTGGSV